MARTYYEIIDDEGKPATPRQQKAYGTPAYGYRSRIAAELACPDNASVSERHEDGCNDWSGRVVSFRGHDGLLHIVVPRKSGTTIA